MKKRTKEASARTSLLAALALPALMALPLQPSGGCTTTAPAATPASASASTGRAAAPSAALAAALDAVRADSIQADIVHVSSDEMGGRDTPSRGLEMTARYIRDRLVQLRWQPGGGEQGYLPTYELARTRLDETQSSVVVERGGTSTKLAFGADYFLTSRSQIADHETGGGLVFCGAGTEEDFEQSEVDERWAVCFDAGEESRKLGSRARKAGAVGLIVAPGPEYSGKPYAERFAEDTAEMRVGRVESLESEEGRRPRRGRELFPSLMLTRAAAVGLVGSEGVPKVGTDLGASVTDVRVIEGGGRVAVENVCGFWPGDDPKLAAETILVSAHYDHVGTQNGVVFNGADDNGSGTSALMSIAEALARYGPMRRSVMLIWVSGEEKGLWGSAAWAANPTLPAGYRAITDINIDMVGRNAPDELLVTPTRARDEYNGLVRLIEKLAPLEGFPELGSADRYYTRSDHINFAKLGIPVAFLFSDVHDDYHGPGDDAEKIDSDKARRVTRLVVRTLDALQADELDL
jgi:hypothetical protein